MTTATAVKETPLLMKPELVCATLEDRKTITRRLNGLQLVNESPGQWACDGFQDGDSSVAMFHSLDRQHALQLRCPYGGPGDLLWVREPWQLGTGDGKTIGINVQVKTEPWCVEVPAKHRDAALAMAQRIGYGGRWRPSIHMPRWASRLKLEITDVRVERVQAIRHNVADLEAEGLELLSSELYPNTNRGSKLTAVFERLWSKINGAVSWESNPWVWVVCFKRLATPPTTS